MSSHCFPSRSANHLYSETGGGKICGTNLGCWRANILVYKVLFSSGVKSGKFHYFDFRSVLKVLCIEIFLAYQTWIYENYKMNAISIKMGLGYPNNFQAQNIYINLFSEIIIILHMFDMFDMSLEARVKFCNICFS